MASARAYAAQARHAANQASMAALRAQYYVANAPQDVLQCDGDRFIMADDICYDPNVLEAATANGCREGWTLGPTGSCMKRSHIAFCAYRPGKVSTKTVEAGKVSCTYTDAAPPVYVVPVVPKPARPTYGPATCPRDYPFVRRCFAPGSDGPPSATNRRRLCDGDHELGYKCTSPLAFEDPSCPAGYHLGDRVSAAVQRAGGEALERAVERARTCVIAP